MKQNSREFKLLRIGDLKEKLCLRRSTIYNHMGKGLIPPNFKIGDRAVVWLESEIDRVVQARIEGCTSLEIQNLVKQIVLDRKPLKSS
mgnify:CR=1 FL=1